MITSITSVSVCDSSESTPETNPKTPSRDSWQSEEESIPALPITSYFCPFITHCLRSTKSVLNKTLLKSISLMHLRPEIIFLINSVLVPLFISSLVVLKPANSKKLYAAYYEGPFFQQNHYNSQPWNFHDIHDSSLDALDTVIASSKATIILSYAHWSVNSLDSRDTFLSLAQQFSAHGIDSKSPQDGISFVAIDCWNPSGRCRNVSNGLSSFPRILIVIPEIDIKVRYRGPVTFYALKQEIESLLQPYSVVHSLEQMRVTLTSSPCSVVVFDDTGTNSDVLLALYQLRARLTVATFPSAWSRPTLMVVTSNVLKSYLCNMDYGISSQECSDFTEMKQPSVSIYRGQKIAKVFVLNDNPSSVLVQLWETIQVIYAPEIATASWREALKSERIHLPRTQLELVDSRIISSLTEVVSKQFDFTFILHSRDEKLVLDFLALKRSLDSCKKNYKKLYCATLQPGLCGILENADCVFCQLCTKYDNLPSILQIFFSEMVTENTVDTEKQDFLKMILRRSASLSCYDSEKKLIDAENLIWKDMEIQKSFSSWRSAFFTKKFEKDMIVGKVLPLSKCRQNSTMQVAFSTSSDITPTHSETQQVWQNYFKNESSFLNVFEQNSKQVFRVNITSLDDVLVVVKDFVSKKYDIGQSKSLLNYEFPKHFAHQGVKSSLSKARYDQSKNVTSNGSEKSTTPQEGVSELEDSAFKEQVSFCNSGKVWQGNNSINCLVLHYTSWCGFCKTVLHVFHTVSHLMTSKFPNVTEFIQVNSGIDNVPWQHSVSKFPAIVFYPASSTAAIHSSHTSRLKLGRRAMNFTHIYPADVAITVPNLYGFVRLHSGVY